MQSAATASPQSVFWYLKNFNLFDNFSRADLAEVTKLLHLQEFKKAQIITIPLDTERRIYFLLKGKAKLVRFGKDGKEIILVILREGEIFGLLAMMLEEYSSSLVVALEKCLVGIIRESDFRRLMHKKPELYLAISKHFGARLLKIENRLDELLFQDISARLARLLLRLANEYPGRRSCGKRINLKLTQQDLANLIGASRETTNMALNNFKNRGWLGLHQRSICLHDVDALKKLAG
jgi:CRP/FNR family transcriptional regulator